MTLPIILEWSWLGLLVYIVIFVTTPFKYKQGEFIWKPVTNQQEKEEYRRLKDHNMTLAGFTFAALAIMFSLPNAVGNEISRLAIFYFSISLALFFTSSYLFDYRIKRIYPYVGQVGEFTGILALGLGFLSFANTVFDNDYLVMLIYIIFMVVIIIISSLEIYYNKKFFQPEPMANENSEDESKKLQLIGAAGVDRCPICDSVMRNNVCLKGCKASK